MKLDTNLIPKLVEDKFDLIKSLYEYNPQGSYTYGQPAFCPFHENENTQAAAIYKSVDDRPDSLFCFAEYKQYTVVDVLGKLMGYNIYEVGHAIWNEMTEVEKKEFLTRHSRVDRVISAFTESATEKETKPNNVLIHLNNFKLGRDTIRGTLKKLVQGAKK